MLKRILIVEDDDFFRGTIADVLQDKYTIYQAPNGKSACEILSIQDVELVLTDVQMPNYSGIELLSWSRTHKPVSFVMMTGFSTILETKSAYELGAKGFIAKPFKINELLLIIKNILNESDEPFKNNKKTVSDYCRVSIDDFIAKSKVDFDIYIKLSDANFIKIANKNQELPESTLSQYKAKNLKYLYILKDDFSKLIEFNLDLAKIIKTRSDISPDKKMAFLKYTGETLLEKTFTQGIDSDSLNEATAFAKLTIDSVLNFKDNLDLLSILQNHSNQTYVDTISVLIYSLLITKQLDIESSITHFKICLAGLFHDIGKKEIEEQLLFKPRYLVTKEERALIENHVVRGYEILSEMNFIPSDVTRLVYEHHEDQEGQGFPFRKNKKDQHPLSKILQCASLLTENISMARANNSAINISSIIDRMDSIYGTRIDPSCMQALRKIFNV